MKMEKFHFETSLINGSSAAIFLCWKSYSVKMQLQWTHKQVLKRLLISFQVQSTLGSSEVLNAFPQQKHKGDNQRVRIPQG